MVIARITSGLGNQLFQYALGRHLANTNQTSLYLDLSYYRQTYDTDTLRLFKLDRFATDYRLLNTSPLVYASKLTRLLPNRTLKPLAAYVKEPHFHVDPSVQQARAAMVILDGFWQSERYFASSAGVLRRELTFRRTPGPAFENFRRQIASAAVPVSVHIRRGDYVNHPEFSQSFGFLGLEYYERALAQLLTRFPGATFFVFSDEPAWVAANLPLHSPHVFVQNTGLDADVDDLQLMSLCHHHIIANSSFSWWGAWLNPRPDKVVLAPQHWFRNKPDWDTVDLIPDTWARV